MSCLNCNVTFLPLGLTVKVKRGTTVLEAARRAGVPIRTRCGGNAACFMCKVKIEPGSELMPIGEKERIKLGGLEEDGFRLSCQARVGGAVRAAVPPDPLREAVLRRLREQEEDDALW